MAAESKQHDDVYEWIKQIIGSCKNTHQLHVADRLINQYYHLYKDPVSHRELYIYADTMFYELYNKQNEEDTK